MVVEPAASDALEDNPSPIGRIYYSATTMICVLTSLAQEMGLALGALASEKRISDVIRSRGFNRVKRDATSPLNMVLEAVRSVDSGGQPGAPHSSGDGRLAWRSNCP